MVIWFKKRNNGKKIYNSKLIIITYIPKHWKLCQWKTNGALKGVKEHRCYDLNIYFLGICFSYTNWDFNYELNITPSNMRYIKINKIKNKIKLCQID